MSKDPAFLFYPNDYIGGTMGMTFEEKGAYIELLMLQFNRGHMTSDMAGRTVGQLWVKIQDKFKVDKDGLYYNERLDIEIDKRKTFVQSRFNNLSGKNQYSKKEVHKGGHMSNHMENVNEDENVNEEKPIFDFKKSLIAIGVSEQIATEWMKVRKNKKASNTETAFKAIEKQIKLTGVSANDCIKKAVEKSWCGFESEWYVKTVSSTVSLPSTLYPPVKPDAI